MVIKINNSQIAKVHMRMMVLQAHTHTHYASHGCVVCTARELQSRKANGHCCMQTL